ncbi:hypothetical protein ACI6Q2_12600 [Chitinophagaceae bacterium LWZ2-11]
MMDNNLHFIQNKMRDAGQAMIYRCLDENHKQPLGIRKFIELDHNGNMFLSLNNDFEKKYCDDIFPIEMFFYQKGKPFYVSVKGIAEKDDLPTGIRKQTINRLKIKPEEFEYGELEEPGLTTFQKFIKGLSNIQAVL